MSKAKKTPAGGVNPLARFLSHARSLADIVTEFDLTIPAAQKALQDLPLEGFDVFKGPVNFHGDPTWIAIPDVQLSSQKIKGLKRQWVWSTEITGQPYGQVRFLSSFSPDKIKIIPLDGILFGDVAHDARRFETILAQIQADPNTFAFLNGDILGEVKGGSKGDRERKFLELTSRFISKMAPIANKILWAQQGCLEARSLEHQGFDPLAYCCERLGVPYFCEPIYIDILWGKNLYSLWAMHGNSTAQLKGARMNALRRPAVMHDHTHFLIAGHVGDAMWNRVIKICRDPVAGKLVPKEEFHCTLGNFKKYLGTRSARRGHAPSSTETLVLCLYPDGTHHVKTAHQEVSNA